MILTILLLAIIIVSISIVKGPGKRQSQWFSGSGTIWFIKGYAILLIGSAFIYQLIPKAEEVKKPDIAQEEMNQFYNGFHDAALKGELESFEGSVKVEEWVFDNKNIF